MPGTLYRYLGTLSYAVTLLHLEWESSLARDFLKLPANSLLSLFIFYSRCD
jgi:hypothetical protein